MGFSATDTTFDLLWRLFVPDLVPEKHRLKAQHDRFKVARCARLLLTPRGR